MNFFSKAKTESPENWDLDKVIHVLEGTDNKGITDKYPLRIRDLCEGTLILGQPGSGKTSGSANALFRSCLRAGFGGLVTTIKPDDADKVWKMAKKEGRDKDIVIFSEESGFCFDPILFELGRTSRGAGDISNLVDLIIRLNTLANSDASGGGEDSKFWHNAMYRLTRNALDLLHLSDGITITNLIRLIIDAYVDGATIEKYCSLLNEHRPLTTAEKENKVEILFDLVKNNYVLGCIEKARFTLENNGAGNRVFEIASSYFLKQFISLSDKTRSSIAETMLGLLEPFNFSTLQKCFEGSITDDLRPEKTYLEGKIIVLDFPTQSYNQVGKLAQGFYRLSWMGEMIRRECGESSQHRPVVLFQDEAHASLIPEYENAFLAVSRSARVASISISQNVNSYIVGLGRVSPHAKMKNLFGNFSTKILHANSDFDTNKFASDLLFEAEKEVITTSVSNSGKQTNTSKQFVPQVRPIDITKLRTGGPQNEYKVDAFVAKVGKDKDWHGSNFVRATFTQMKE